MPFSKNIFLFLRIIRKILHIPEHLPRFVQISFTNHCNLSCAMCIRNYIDVEKRHMQWDDFTTIVGKLDGVEQISLAGMGESLTHPRIFDAIRYCRKHGFKTQLTTNALLLDTDDIRTRIIESGLERISFSIESVRSDYAMGHANTKVHANIQRLIELKKTLHVSHPKVTLQPILFSDKIEDVYEIIRWGAEHEVDRINVVRVDLRFVPNLKRPTVQEERNIYRKFAALRKQYNIRIDCLQDQIFDGVLGFLYKHGKKLLRLDSWCYRFQDFIYINVNGDVHPCCYSKEQIMGNLLKNDLRSIWHGERFRHLRSNQSQYAYCKKCDFLRLKQLV